MKTKSMEFLGNRRDNSRGFYTNEFNLIGGCIEDLCFRLGSLVTTRVSTRDKRKARPQRPSRPNTNRCPPSRGKLASGVCQSKYSLRVVESIIAYTIPLGVSDT